MGLASGGRLSALAQGRIRGEWAFLVSLVLNATLPGILSRFALPGWAAVAAWLCAAAVLVAVSAANLEKRGFALISLGVALNAVVILLNLGMPVDLAVARDLSGGNTLAGPVAGGIHIARTATTRLSLLADTLPLVLPSGQVLLISLGDMLLLVGVCAFIVCQMGAANGGKSRRQEQAHRGWLRALRCVVWPTRGRHARRRR